MSPIDTVENAKATPNKPQPWNDLGLREDEYLHIREILGRRPTTAELSMYSVMWSEHCSYKSSKVHLRKFSELSSDTPIGKSLAGIGENAGVVDIGQGYAVTFKVESHNHPSYYEPFDGAATGIGGVVRDILAMGARPVAVLAPLRFGPIDASDTSRVVPAVFQGLKNYGETLGLPSLGGEVYFDERYAGNPLVNALAVGLMRHEDLHTAHASGVGNRVILFGARTGRDGVGSAVFASEAIDDETENNRPNVPVGDPELEKRLIEATLESFKAGLVKGIQDLGAAGISCATSELASSGEGGMHIRLDRVPVREVLTPEEILMSESQERMMGIVEPENVDAFMAICEKWDIEAVDIGEVTSGGRLVVDYGDERICDVPPRSVAIEGPVYNRAFARPDWHEALQEDDASKLSRPNSGEELRAALLAVVTSPNLADKSWFTKQYDSSRVAQLVQGDPEDAGVLRVDDQTNLGIAFATDCNARYVQLDPYVGSQLALVEAYRNVAMSGALPIAITDGLNFGSAEDPGVMWQFVQSTDGLKDGCAALGIPVTGGNVSFYNQTGDTAILPTPIVGVMGVIEDVNKSLKSGFKNAGDHILLIGKNHDELSGSVWAQVMHNHLGGRPPRVHFETEINLANFMVEAAKQVLLDSAHDLSDGGLAAAVCESAFVNNIGAELNLTDPFMDLFSESSARAIITVSSEKHEKVMDLLDQFDLEVSAIGKTGGDSIAVVGQFTVDLAELKTKWAAKFPQIFTRAG